MNEQTKKTLKTKIDKATVVSFDIFDTLLFRKTNAPETIFDLVGKHFHIPGFRKLRMKEQDEASRRAYQSFQYPHADMDQIYEVLSEHTEFSVDWNTVKQYEIQLEDDSLVANDEMKEFFDYAKDQGKRIIIVSDMYLPASILASFLEKKGYCGFDRLYCSADEHKAKFNQELFNYVLQCEAVPCEEILHIGDKQRDDGDFPADLGFSTFVYQRTADLEKVKKAAGSDVDAGIYKILYNEDKGFWYNLGVEVGGPIYMGLCQFILKHIKQSEKKLYLLARDGYVLYHILKKLGYDNVEYVYTSRRALTLAAISCMNEKDIESLPPYTFGQTVGEILDYLCVKRSSIKHLDETGLSSFDTIIRSVDDIEAFKKLYILDKDVFLERCEIERENAKKYYESVGLLAEDAFCFDCGWQGSSQELLERFKHAIGCKKKHHFLYFGIKNGDKSRKQLNGMHYDAFLFDFYKNYSLQADLALNVAMYELFFSAPHESVHFYDADGSVVFETGDGAHEKESILMGVWDFVKAGIAFVNKYDVEYTPEISLGHLKRLIHNPTEEEAVQIGDMQNVDGFARQRDGKQYFAYITKAQIENEENIQVYWPAGLLKRPDISEEVKLECAKRLGVQYPEVVSEYHLEDERNIRSFYRWIRHNEKRDRRPVQLEFSPKFSVVIPVYNTVTEQLEECFQSVLKQNYENYELILVDDHSSWENVRPILQKYEAEPKVRVIYRETNGHISTATNDGIAVATGDFIVFMDCDDAIEPDALMEFAKKLNENPELDFIYSDEDKITEDGKIHHMPFFKPDWSPDLFLNMMYTNHLATYRTSIVKEVGGLRTAFNGSQDYDFTLRFMERTHNSRVGHVSKILYHWRERKESVAYSINSKNYAAEAARNAKEDLIRRNGIAARLEVIPGLSQYRIVYDVVGQPLVSIIIPSKDHLQVLEQCIHSIKEFTCYQNYEIIVVDNGSNETNQEKISQYLAAVGAKYIYHEEEFNFSHMCNLGAENAKGDFLLFLNDDIEVFQPDWLDRMLGHAQREHTGAVGAKLFYPRSTLIQHSGVSCTEKDGPVHNYLFLDDQTPYYFGWNWVDNNCIAVTGACLLIAKSKFLEVGGFDNELAVAYNDVKLCFALHEKGYYNVIRNDVVAYHHESLSRGTDQDNDKKLIRLGKERTKLFSQFPDLRVNDPYLNPHMARRSLVLELKWGYDALSKMDLSDCLPTDDANIDFVTPGENVKVVGWSILKGEEHIEELDRYLVVKDPFGNTYGARGLPFYRPDVVAHFNDTSYAFSGFECVLDAKELGMEKTPYQFGILTVARDGTRYLKWGYSTTVIRQPQPRPTPLAYQAFENQPIHENNEDIQWSLDDCEHKEDYLFIRGFAYKRGECHYQYETSIVLLESNEKGIECATHQEERIDVAYSFINEHFLRYTGFLCYIFEGVLEAGREYDVIIRLRNRFDPADIRDVVTGRKVVG